MKLLLFIVCCTTPFTTSAEVNWIAFTDTGGSIAERGSGDTFGPRDGFLNYDNLTFLSEGGRTDTIDFPRFGSQEIGDDLGLVAPSQGFLSDGSCAFINLSTTNTLTRLTLARRWYDSAGNRIGQRIDNLNLAGGLPPMTGAIINTTGGLFRPLNIPLNGVLRWSLQFTNVQGISIDDLAFVVAGPHTRGYSSSLIHNYSTSQDIDLGNNGNSNLMFKAYGVAPAPSTTLLGLLGTMVACRRRR